MIAEEVATVYPELVTRTATGEVQTVKYQDLIPMLLNELQHEHQARQQESARVAALEAQLAALQALVAARLVQTVAQDGPGDSMRYYCTSSLLVKGDHDEPGIDASQRDASASLLPPRLKLLRQDERVASKAE